jgi:hypothetical protein
LRVPVQVENSGRHASGPAELSSAVPTGVQAGRSTSGTRRCGLLALSIESSGPFDRRRHSDLLAGRGATAARRYLPWRKLPSSSSSSGSPSPLAPRRSPSGGFLSSSRSRSLDLSSWSEAVRVREACPRIPAAGPLRVGQDREDPSSPRAARGRLVGSRSRRAHRIPGQAPPPNQIRSDELPHDCPIARARLTEALKLGG